MYNMRFSKKSVSRSFTFTEGDEDTGAFLALCRVYVVKLLTIDETFTNRIIEGALDNGYDAIFSTVTGEYSLRNPHHVLPEFVIQCAITTNVNSVEKTSEVAVAPPSKPRADIEIIKIPKKGVNKTILNFRLNNINKKSKK